MRGSLFYVILQLIKQKCLPLLHGHLLILTIWLYYTEEKNKDGWLKLNIIQMELFQSLTWQVIR